MSEGAIEPSAVYPPGNSQRFYDTYNTRYMYPATGPAVPAPQYGYRDNWAHRMFQRMPNGSGTNVGTPSGVPRFLGARPLLFFAWMCAMGMVSLDEWHTYHILPRPQRLWETSLFFGLLAVLSVFDSAVPLANAIALGYVIVLGYQYYTGTGQFGPYGATESGYEPAEAPAQGTSSGGQRPVSS